MSDELLRLEARLERTEDMLMALARMLVDTKGLFRTTHYEALGEMIDESRRLAGEAAVPATMNLNAVIEAIRSLAGHEVLVVDEETLAQTANDVARKVERLNKAPGNYDGEIIYWQAVGCLLQAALLSGGLELPHVDLPVFRGTRDEIMSQLERFGRDVLAKAQASRREEST